LLFFFHFKEIAARFSTVLKCHPYHSPPFVKARGKLIERPPD